MNTKEIKQLIEILETSGLESLTYKNESVEIQLKKPSINSVSVPQMIPVHAENAPVLETNKETLNSPLVGVFYAKPSPDADAFVSVGQKVNQGDVVCIIEAMKVMNEIKAQKSGVIQEVLLSDGDTVDFDQPMYVIG